MPKKPAPHGGITYVCTDDAGFDHVRFMGQHASPLYTWAAVLVPGSGARGACSMFSTSDRAFEWLDSARGQVYGRDAAELAGDMTLVGRPLYPRAQIAQVRWRRGR